MKSFVIKRVLKLRGFVRVIFSNGITLNFSDKFGQYKQFKTNKKQNVRYTEEQITMYLI